MEEVEIFWRTPDIQKVSPKGKQIFDKKAKGDNLAEITYTKLCQHLVNSSSVIQIVNSFSTCFARKICVSAKKQNIWIEIHCTCGRQDIFDDNQLSVIHVVTTIGFTFHV